jgi:quinol monooxygenase YgiN
MRMTLLTACVALLLASSAQAQDKEPDLITRLKKAKVDGPFTLIVHVKIKKAQKKAFLNAANPCVEATRKEKGCVAYDLLHDSEHSTKFVFVERWKSVKDLEAHFAEDHVKKLLAALPDLLDGDPKFAFYAETK